MSASTPPKWTEPFTAVQDGGRWIVPFGDEKAATTAFHILIDAHPDASLYMAKRAGSHHWFVGNKADIPKRRKDDA